MTQSIVLLRRSFTAKSTQGIMLMPSDTSFPTLEQPWRNNEIGNSCIPEGEYRAIYHVSPKFGPTYWLQGTEPRTEILIHVGNYPSDTIGCILLGMTKETDVVWSSRTAMNKFLAELNKEPCVIKIFKWLY